LFTGKGGKQFIFAPRMLSGTTTTYPSLRAAFAHVRMSSRMPPQEWRSTSAGKGPSPSGLKKPL